MRFIGTCFRAHDPRWSFAPLSGAGAAQKGGRFNPVGCAALYLSLDLTTAILEASQGFSFKVPPLTLVSYTIDCEDIHDLTDPAVLATLAVEGAGARRWLGACRGGGPSPPVVGRCRTLDRSGFSRDHRTELRPRREQGK
nr:RES domain-containing protein [Elstera litoralis]